MANLLDGVQFRTLKPGFPSWTAQQENYFSEWTDCADVTSFPDNTEFRVKPVHVYVVKCKDRTDIITEEKTRAMARVATLTEQNSNVSIFKETKPAPTIGQWLVDKNIQFKLGNSEKWNQGTYFGGANRGATIKFRTRPDYYWNVTIKTGIAQANLSFDDADELSKYIDRQIRTSESDFTITRRAYGITLAI
jgi:hypothetical protein